MLINRAAILNSDPGVVEVPLTFRPQILTSGGDSDAVNSENLTSEE